MTIRLCLILKALHFVLILFFSISVYAQDSRWSINADRGITWTVGSGEVHQDNIEMSGKYISGVIHYGVNPDSSFVVKRNLVWPMLRTIPNNTHASLIRTFSFDIVKMISINEKPVASEKIIEIILDGKITIKSRLDQNIHLTRIMFPSTDKPVFCEKYIMKNDGPKAIWVEVPKIESIIETPSEKGTDGIYKIMLTTSVSGPFLINPGESVNFYQTIRGVRNEIQYFILDVESELHARDALIGDFWNNLVLETPDSILNTAFAFAKIRASESIYETKGGPMHGPGGLRYYAAIWANDQAEYINPFFPYLGYLYGIESAKNSFRHFARYINPEFKPIPSSIIAEGTDMWDGAGDRGDAAMIAYGAARFSMTYGDKATAEELWKLIEWCLEFCRRKLNTSGVVASDSDELEGRFPAGSANLNTSTLYYDALISAALLGHSLNKNKKQLDGYAAQAIKLRKNIEKYFGANVMGYNTYRYYAGNDVLRAWICTPLTVGIFDRKQGTIEALFSPGLWTDDGLASLSGDKTFWDRSTLYALRGVFAAGETSKGLKFLKYYSARRLLGNHVPYPVEAYPEGNQRHLSAESALYCRIYLEGIFGIRPTGLNSFKITPHLPADWEYMRLKRVHGFQKTFDVEVERNEADIKLTILINGNIFFEKIIKNGDSTEIIF